MTPDDEQHTAHEKNCVAAASTKEQVRLADRQSVYDGSSFCIPHFANRWGYTLTVYCQDRF